jgi:hypothetical protein
MSHAIRGTVIVGCIAVLLSAAGPANAAPPKLQWRWTDCGTVGFGSGVIGFATDFPSVYAADATRRRDLQYAYLYTEFYQWSPSGSSWKFAVGTTYKALVSDSNYAIVWRDQSNGQVMHFPYERQQFVVQTTGIYPRAPEACVEAEWLGARLPHQLALAPAHRAELRERREQLLLLHPVSAARSVVSGSRQRRSGPAEVLWRSCPPRPRAPRGRGAQRRR